MRPKPIELENAALAPRNFEALARDDIARTMMGRDLIIAPTQRLQMERRKCVRNSRPV